MIDNVIALDKQKILFKPSVFWTSDAALDKITELYICTSEQGYNKNASHFE